jgi:hypothetical protein
MVNLFNMLKHRISLAFTDSKELLKDNGSNIRVHNLETSLYYITPVLHCALESSYTKLPFVVELIYLTELLLFFLCQNVVSSRGFP